MTVQEALEKDLEALEADGALRKNTDAIQAAMLELAADLDSSAVEARDKATCLKELRAAFEEISQKTSGAQYEEWMERVLGV